MDTSKLTEKSREALSEAQNAATRLGHSEVDGEHLLLALIDQQDGLVLDLLDHIEELESASRRRRTSRWTSTS